MVIPATIVKIDRKGIWDEEGRGKEGMKGGRGKKKSEEREEERRSKGGARNKKKRTRKTKKESLLLTPSLSTWQWGK